MKRTTAIAGLLALAVGVLLGVWLTRGPGMGSGSGTNPARDRRATPARPGTPSARPVVPVPVPEPVPDPTTPTRTATVSPPAAPNEVHIIGRAVSFAEAPIAGAKVGAGVSGTEARVSGETAADGTFRVGPLPPAESIDVIIAGEAPYVDALFGIAAPEPGTYDVGMIKLAEGGRIVGRVIGLDGAPASGIGLEAESREGDRRRTRTAGDGRFEIAGLEPGRYVVATDLGLAAAEATIEGLGARVEVELRMRSPSELSGLIRGVVLGPDGQPRQASVRAEGPDPERIPKLTPAGPDGRFELGVAPGRYRIQAFAEGLASGTATVSVGAGGSAEVEIRLSRGGRVAGRTLRPPAELAGEEVLFCLAPAGGGTDAMSFAVAADGTFEGEEIPAGAYRGMLVTKQQERVAGTESVDVAIKEGEETRVEIGAATPVLTRLRLPPDSNAELAVRDTGVAVARHRSVPGGIEVELPPGRLTIEVLSRDGYAFSHTVQIPAPGNDVVIPIPTGRAKLEGQLSGAIGRRGLRVQATGGAVRAEVTTDLGGRFPAFQLPPGTYTIAAPNYVPREVVLADGDYFELTLEPFSPR